MNVLIGHTPINDIAIILPTLPWNSLAKPDLSAKREGLVASQIAFCTVGMQLSPDYVMLNYKFLNSGFRSL